jgi:hypothetical protein
LLAGSDIPTVAGAIDDVITVAAGIADVGTLAGIAAQVAGVAAISGAVITVAAIDDEVADVANRMSDVTTVANDLNGPNTIGQALIAAAAAAADRAQTGLDRVQTGLDKGAAEAALSNLAMVSSLTFVTYDTKSALATAMIAGGLVNNAYYAVTIDETARGARMLYRYRTMGGASLPLIGILDPITTLNSVAPPPDGLPQGVVIYWAARDYTTVVSGLATKVIPNRATNVAPEPLLSRLTSRQFKYSGAAASTWIGTPNTSALVITDRYGSGPLGRATATRFLGTGGGAQYVQLSPPNPVGVNVFAVWMRSNTSSNQTIRLSGNNGTAFATCNVTPQWQRFYVSWTNVTAVAGVRIQNDSGGSAWDICVDMAKVYSGAVPPVDLPDAGHLYIGQSHSDATPPVVASGVHDGSGAVNASYAQMLDGVSSRELTISVMARVDNTAGTNNYIVVDQLAPTIGMTDLLTSADSPQGNPLGLMGGGTSKSLNQSRNINGKGWHQLTFVLRHNKAFFYVDDVIMSHQDVGVLVAERVIDLWRTGSYTSGHVQNYKWNQIVVARRAFSHAEVRKTFKAMCVVATLDGIAPFAPQRLLVIEGDSKTAYDGAGANANHAYADYCLAQAPVGTWVSRRGFTGSVVTAGTFALDARAEDLDATLPAAADRVGRKFHLHIDIGTNDLASALSAASFITNLQTYIDARLAAGWTSISASTIPPRSDAAANANGFNAKRATANTAIRGWVGGRLVSVADIAADATIGSDGASANTTYYNADQIHWINAGHDIVGPLVWAAVSAYVS